MAWLPISPLSRLLPVPNSVPPVAVKSESGIIQAAWASMLMPGFTVTAAGFQYMELKSLPAAEPANAAPI